MNVKKQYLRPNVRSMALVEEQSLMNLSMEQVDTPAGGGGDAKQSFFEDQEGESGGNGWHTQEW